MTREFSLVAFGLLAWLGFCSSAAARFAMPPKVPIDRLIANTTAYIGEHPDDPMGPYTLARVHYLAFALRSSELKAIGADRPLPQVDDMFGSIATTQPVKDAPPDDALAAHLDAAVRNYRKALGMEPEKALFQLGMASVCEAALTSGMKLGQIPGSTGGQAPADGDYAPQWRELAIASYRRAYELSENSDSKIKERPIHGLESLVSYEAGKRFVAMVHARGPRDDEAKIVARVEKNLAALDSKPMGGITPIIFRLDRPAAIADLLDAKRSVEFDLDGTARHQRYPWVTPATGILVWDPEQSRQITSGHQLFGNVTFNMIWSDGYRALDALDDNRDGVLRGDELKGLSVWFDRNQDAVSEFGEVISIESAGIIALSVRRTGQIDGSPFNPAGLVTSGGAVLPTYDWFTRPLTPPAGDSPSGK